MDIEELKNNISIMICYSFDTKKQKFNPVLLYNLSGKELYLVNNCFIDADNYRSYNSVFSSKELARKYILDKQKYQIELNSSILKHLETL